MARTILHCDLNSFYASVELLSHPELRQQPVAVCGDPDSRKGIILAKNEPAKRCGVKTAETIWQARQKCPDLALLPPHHDQYRQFSRIINDIYGQYTDLVEPFGIDESWLDITGSMHLFGGDARAIADGIRRRISQELGLTLSIGVSFNKVFAKLGSDYRKPDATTVIPPESWQESGLNRLAPAPEQSALCRSRRPAGIGTVRHPHHRRSGGGRTGPAPTPAGETGTAAVGLCQWPGYRSSASPARERAGQKRGQQLYIPGKPDLQRAGAPGNEPAVRQRGVPAAAPEFILRRSWPAVRIPCGTCCVRPWS